MEVSRDHIMPETLYGMYEMELDPITLSFPKNIEQSFIEDFFNKSLGLVRFSLFVGILLYCLFGILDAYIVPNMIRQLWFIRFAVVGPILLGIIVFSYSPRFKKYFQFYVFTAMVVSGFGIVLMILIIPPPANYSYYAGLILVMIWGYTFTRVRFIWATVAGWVIVAFYEFVAIYIDTPTLVLLSNNFFFISAILAGMLASYSIEYYARRDFFLTFKLENERQIVEAANRRLENIVQERTSQLTDTNMDLRQEIEERKRAEKERANLEDMLIQAQKMEAIGTLGGGIAHDFNNLLMGIRGHASLMLADMDANHPLHDNLISIEQYVQAGAELTSQLLAFAMKGKYEVKTTDLNELIVKNVQMFARTNKGISISTQYQDNIWPVDVDQGQIDQVLLNLFVNAAQAMSNSGNLFIRTKNVMLDADYVQKFNVKPGNYIRTSVQDTGVGMDESTIAKIFDPFFTTKEMGRGTGLGLASAYGILRNHGGFIAVASKINEGSTFDFYLPASFKEVVKEKSFEKTLLKGSETILIIDDEDMIIDVTSRMLKKLGYKFLIAQSGHEALELFAAEKNHIDLVILDMIMPGMGGKDTYEALKKINPDVKILLSSGYSISGEAMELINRGCNGYIQKPFSYAQLSLRMREILDKK
jgi:two-component system, cell cycle sensor histidine kinase and response regulator CckA